MGRQFGKLGALLDVECGDRLAVDERDHVLGLRAADCGRGGDQHGGAKPATAGQEIEFIRHGSSSPPGCPCWSCRSFSKTLPDFRPPPHRPAAISGCCCRCQCRPDNPLLITEVPSPIVLLPSVRSPSWRNTVLL